MPSVLRSVEDGLGAKETIYGSGCVWQARASRHTAGEISVRNLNVRPSAIISVLRDGWSHEANHGARTRALARLLRFQLRGRLTNRATVVPFGRSSKIAAHVDDLGSRRAATAPLPDHAEMLVWLAFLQRGHRFVDVGANVGLYTVLAAECGADVIAFEPLAAAREQLAANLELNGYRADLRAEALGAAEGTLQLDGVDPQRMHLQAAPNASGVTVRVTTLDAVLGDEIAHGVKIDVEGAERLVLEGTAMALQAQRIELLQLEWNDTSEVNFGESRALVAELLDAAGYKLYRPDQHGTLHPVTDPGLGADVFAMTAAVRPDE